MSGQEPWFRVTASILRSLKRPAGMLLASALVCLLLTASVFSFYYQKYSRLIDQKLERGPFANTSNIYSAPRTIGTGQRVSMDDIVSYLRRCGYSESNSNQLGRFVRKDDSIEIHPGPKSYFDEEEEDPAVISISKGKIARIVSLRDNKPRNLYQLEPQLIANVSDRNRERRRLARFSEIPDVLVKAVVATEDKRFFEHGGIDSVRVFKAAYVDLKERRKEQGASTITMQLARSLWLQPDKNWRRKLAEAMMTVHLEQRLSKQQIFEYYANEVYLGRRGTFSIHGFGQAARDYFGKELHRLTLPEAATLAGLIQRPSYFDPFRFPERARERRNAVLSLMRQNGYISREACTSAAAAQLALTPAETKGSETPYFMDLVNNELLARGHGTRRDFQNVYTTLDLDLQRAAVEAVAIGAEKLDKRLAKTRKKGDKAAAVPEVALVALNPRTGAVQALVGGRNYGASQLNRALAKRQPGSAFKTFVYAAALNTAIAGGRTLFTSASVVEDEPTTFTFGDEEYAPGNFQGASFGSITLRQGLTRSANIVTVKVAESVGYLTVAKLARAAGLKAYGTPSIALGSYEVTPLELAGAYTVFANQGVFVSPALLSQIRDEQGKVVFSQQPQARQVLDPRVSYLMVNMLEDVMARGTGVGARSEGFYAPAAGKTGTTRDGWFAGFTSDLLCVVWVGFDDNRDLNVEGAKSALPIWTEFMKRAIQLPAYRNPKPFKMPAGIASAEIDSESGLLAGPYCPESQMEYFIPGTQPEEWCDLHSAFRAALPGETDPRQGQAPVAPVGAGNNTGMR